MTSTQPVALLTTETFARIHAARFEALLGVGRGLDLHVLTGRDGDAIDGEAAFLSPDEYPDTPANLFRTALKAPSLRWFHTMSAGVDHPAFGALRERGVRLSTSSGAAAVPIAHAVFMHLLALTRRLPRMIANRATAKWDRLPGVDLTGTTVVIAGMGPIGTEAARLAGAFGMRAIGLRRTVRGDEPCETWTLDRWPEALALADHLVLALPLTSATRHILDAGSLAVLKAGATVVNVGRGELIDEPALIESLRSGHLGGAGLDVTAIEPLPSDSPLWTMENVLLTPHNSSAVPSTNGAVTEFFFDNLRRYLRNELLRNEVTG
jgi:phosphoglycerate dehydrogenase-like enzyme